MPEFRSTIKVDTKGTKKTKQELGGIEGSLKKLGKSAALAAGGFFGARMLIQGFKVATDAAVRQEKAIQTLEQVMKSMGRFTPKASRQLQEYAKQLSRVTTFSDEAVLEGIGFLQTYKQIADDVMPQAINVMADIASLMGGDMQIAANKVGKAAMGMTGELREVGITIDEDVAASGDFVAILNEIENQVGGVAKATGEGLGGSLARMTNSVVDAAQALGELLAPVIITVAGVLEKAARWANRFFGSMQPTTIEDVVAGLEDIGAEAEKIARLEKLALTRDIIQLSAEMRQLGLDSDGMAKITKALAFEEEILTSQMDHLAKNMDSMQGGAIERTMAIIEGTEANKAELEAQAELIRSYEVAVKQLETYTERKEAAKKATEEKSKMEAEFAENIGKTNLALRDSPMPEFDASFKEYQERLHAVLEGQKQEADNLARLIDKYPKLAKSLGLMADEEERAKAAKEAKVALITQELKSAALVQGSAKDAMKAVVRAESMEAVAGLIASILKDVPFPLNVALAAGGGAWAAGLMDKGLAQFAEGGDFVTKGPQMIMVGDNPGGRERVQVTPLSSPNVSGPTNSFSINVSAPLVDETVVDSIIPAIQKAQRLGTA